MNGRIVERWDGEWGRLNSKPPISVCLFCANTERVYVSLSHRRQLRSHRLSTAIVHSAPLGTRSLIQNNHRVIAAALLTRRRHRGWRGWGSHSHIRRCITCATAMPNRLPARLRCQREAQRWRRRMLLHIHRARPESSPDVNLLNFTGLICRRHRGSEFQLSARRHRNLQHYLIRMDCRLTHTLVPLHRQLRRRRSDDNELSVRSVVGGVPVNSLEQLKNRELT